MKRIIFNIFLTCVLLASPLVIFIGCNHSQAIKSDAVDTIDTIAEIYFGDKIEPYIFQIWNEKIIYTSAQRIRMGLDWWPDGNIGAVKHGDNSYSFYAANGPNPKMVFGTLDDPAKFGRLNIKFLNQKESFNYMAGGPVYRLNEDTLLLFYHAEKHPKNDPKAFLSQLGLAVSKTRDKSGHFIDFRDLGIIIRANKSYNNPNAGYIEMRGSPFVVYNDFLYVYFTDHMISGSTYETAVARASITDITAAVNNNTAPLFQKYYDGGFTENGIGGRSSPLEIGNPSSYWTDVSYNSYLNKFLMVVSQWRREGSAALYLAISDDGINWSRRMLISDEDGELFYPSIMGTGDDPRITGREFYIYYTHSLRGAWNRWGDAKLIRRKISLE